MSDVCYICTTPFQLMTILALQLKNKESADLYIDPHFDDVHLYQERIKRLGIFNNVILIDEFINNKIRQERNKLKRKIKIIFLFKSNYIKKLFNGKIYAKVYTSSNALIFLLIRKYYRKNGIDFDTIYFDDGEGSYDDFIKIYNEVIKYNKSTLQNVYLYSPELFRECYPDFQLDIKEIPRWFSKNEIKESIEYVFKKKEEVVLKDRIIILDTIKNECLASADATKLELFYKKIAEKCHYKNIILKKHPRDKNTCGRIKEYKYNSIPFEYIAMESNINDKVLISLSSSAVIMPKIVLDQEPTVILLYKLFKMTIGEDLTRDTMYKKCKYMYRNTEKFIIPSNWDELHLAINEILKIDLRK